MESRLRERITSPRMTRRLVLSERFARIGGCVSSHVQHAGTTADGGALREFGRDPVVCEDDFQRTIHAGRSPLTINNPRKERATTKYAKETENAVTNN